MVKNKKRGGGNNNERMAGAWPVWSRWVEVGQSVGTVHRG
jgi:hypothetical protein